MRVTRIEMFGFKSFMDRLVLNLEHGITGVVGPNGCGKSNIVDALRWVLGETRAKNLRGDTIEDVIFNGTDKLRPLGLAEVSVTLRSSGENFFSDLVSPSLEAELAYEVESEKAASEVEQEDKGQAEDEKSEKPRLTVISGGLDQGRSENQDDSDQAEAKVQENNSQEAPKETAPAEAVNVSATLLNRFSWLRAANEVQVTRRLYRSGESEYFINRVPCRLKDLKELFLAVGIGAKAHTIVAQGEVGRIVSAKPEQRRLILEEAAGVLGFREKIAAAERRLVETEVNISRLVDIEKEVSRQVQVLKRQAARARNRRALKEEIVTLDLELLRGDIQRAQARYAQVRAEHDAIVQQEAELEAGLQVCRAEEEAQRAELLQLDVEGDGLRHRIDHIREELRNRADAKAEKKSRSHELRAFILSRQTEFRRLEERIKMLQERQTQGRADGERLRAEELALGGEVEQLGADNEDELRALAQGLEEKRAQLREEEQKLREIRERLSRNQGELAAIEKQIIAASPLTQLGSTVKSKAMEAFTGAAAAAKPFVESLVVPDEHVRAVQGVLAEKAAFLVTEDPYALASKFVHEVLSDQENKEGLALGVLRSDIGLSEQGEARSSVPRPEFPRLLDCIEVQAPAREAAARIFDQVYLAPSVQSAIAFFESLEPEARFQSKVLCVSPEGDCLSAHSFYSFRNDGGMLTLQNRLRQLQQLIRDLEQEQGVWESHRDVTQAGLQALENQQREALQRSKERQASLHQLHQHIAVLRGRRQAEERAFEQLARDLEKGEQQAQETTQKIAEFEAEQTRIDEELLQTNAEDESLLHAELRELNEKYARADEIRRAGRTVLAEASRKFEEARTALEQARRNTSGLELDKQKSVLAVQQVYAKVRDEYSEECWKYCLGLAEHQSFISRFLDAQDALVVASAIQFDEAGATQQQDMQEAAPETERSVFQRGTVHEAGLEGDLDDEQALAILGEALQGNLPDEEKRREQREELSRLKARIAREGEVDPSSIQQYESELARLESLSAQAKDLDHAARTLRKTIERLRQTSRTRFVETFEAVRKNFALLVPKLFGGGHGDLELLDPENPLETGVAISVRPPGKKPKSIDVLSGGEKALCATALIFAMFIERPSPLCVLDEVDAPLDEANLARYLSLIREMSTKTQFLMITHNKASMSFADKLVGVTMQEPGASKVIAVSLQEAYRHVA